MTLIQFQKAFRPYLNDIGRARLAYQIKQSTRDGSEPKKPLPTDK